MNDPEQIIEAQYKDISGETELDQIKKGLNIRRIQCLRASEVAFQFVDEIADEMMRSGPDSRYILEVMKSRAILAGDFFQEIAAMAEAQLNDIHQQTAPSIVVPDTTIVDKNGDPIGQG